MNLSSGARAPRSGARHQFHPTFAQLARPGTYAAGAPSVRLGHTGQLHVGWEWVLLRREFAQRPSQLPHERPLVLVTMGGSDPAGLTLKAVSALDLLDEACARARIPTISAPADLSAGLVVTVRTVAEVLAGWVGVPAEALLD